jgi:hypothetical protein
VWQFRKKLVVFLRLAQLTLPGPACKRKKQVAPQDDQCRARSKEQNRVPRLVSACSQETLWGTRKGNHARAQRTLAMGEAKNNARHGQVNIGVSAQHVRQRCSLHAAMMVGAPEPTQPVAYNAWDHEFLLHKSLKKNNGDTKDDCILPARKQA